MSFSPPSDAPARTVRVQARTVATTLLVVTVFLLLLFILYEARRVVTWVFIALFLALALNPAVEFFERRGMRRGLAAAVVFLIALLAFVLVGLALIPPLVRQVTDFANNVPNLLHDLTRGRGPLGFLERRYQVVERVQEAINKSGGGSRALRVTSPLLTAVTTIITAVVGTVTIAFLTLFMLLEGPTWAARFEQAVPEVARGNWNRAAHGIYRTIGGYVTGNILISIIAGTATTIVLLVLGVPYAFALGLIVAILDLIPLAGATIAAVVVTGVAFTQGVVAGIIVILFFIVYQQVENHVLQPLIYGRTVQLSPLAVLIAVLIGGEILGVIGALAAIPIGGSIQVIAREIAVYRRDRQAALAGNRSPSAPAATADPVTHAPPVRT